ncbi:MAG: chromate transporter [Candidatus Brocadiia bacterium]
MKPGPTHEEKVPYWTLISTYFRIGLMTFGGGFAMATVVRHELVLKRKWLSEKEFVNTLSLATAVPGSIAVNLAFIEGRRMRGMLGGVGAAIGTISPSVLVILIIARFGAPYFDHPVVGAFLKGCAVAVVGQIGFATFTFARKLRPHWKNGFICGLGLLVVVLGAHPVLAVVIAGSAGYLLMHEHMTPREKAAEMEILKVIEGIPAQELVGSEFQTDMEDVVRDADDGITEELDDIIRQCPVLDIERTMGVEKLLDLAADKLAEDVSISAEEIAGALKKREAKSPTVMTQYAAVPHAIVEDGAGFEIMIIRSREGVAFSDDASEVKAVFVIVGSLEDRDIYVSALAYVATAVAQERFYERWMLAEDTEELRVTVLSAGPEVPDDSGPSE